MYRAGSAGVAPLRYQRGMSLLSLVMALFLGALLMSASLRLVSGLRRQGLSAWRQQQRREEASALLARLEKDLRRSGFCAPPCPHPVPRPRIAAMTGEVAASCVLLAYDLDGNGHITADEHFGWRLHRGALEGSRQARSCDGNGWERVSDERRWRIETLHFSHDGAVFQVTLCLAERRYPDAPQRQHLWLRAPNLAWEGAR